MGLTTWKNAPDGRVLKSDVAIARYEDWERLRQVSSTGNIYIPRFYRDKIVSIDGNTNIFIYSENMPVFSHNVITLRPRTHATISCALCRAGMDINEANRLVAETEFYLENLLLNCA